MEPMFWVWLGIVAVSLLIEIVTMELVSIWFAVGGIIPFIMAAIRGVPIAVQIVVFVVISALLIIFLRKYAQKFLFKNMNEKTNLDSLCGKRFKLLEDIDLEKNGSIKINGVVWTAISENSQPIKAGQFVEVIKVDGNKIVVKEASSENNNKVAEVKQEEKEEVKVTPEEVLKVETEEANNKEDNK